MHSNSNQDAVFHPVFVEDLRSWTKIDRKIASKADEWDFQTLTSELQNLKKRFPDTQTLTLSAGNDIEYLHVIKTMEAAKQTIPAILLGGF